MGGGGEGEEGERGRGAGGGTPAGGKRGWGGQRGEGTEAPRGGGGQDRGERRGGGGETGGGVQLENEVQGAKGQEGKEVGVVVTSHYAKQKRALSTGQSCPTQINKAHHAKGKAYQLTKLHVFTTYSSALCSSRTMSSMQPQVIAWHR